MAGYRNPKHRHSSTLQPGLREHAGEIIIEGLQPWKLRLARRCAQVAYWQGQSICTLLIQHGEL